jgi:outer membrane murein-binding lipoprotein Lpp
VRNALVLVAVVAALALAGCASKSEEKNKPKNLTEPDVRAKLTATQTSTALREVKDDTTREALTRHFELRAREARRRSQRDYAVEKILIGEDIGIGGGLKLTRVFALAHEYDASSFTTFLESAEFIGARVHQAHRIEVGRSSTQLASLEFLDLDRAALRTYRFAAKDPPCCPSVVVDRVYVMRGITLEEMR